MEIEYNNLYTHLIFTTLKKETRHTGKRQVLCIQIITGVINNYASRLYAIYANPEHVHFLISRDPGISEQRLATIVADSSEKFIN
ncbi:MAG: transposase [Bacteroidales bacterium]|nr:transposase [Bacteroidales bacterium]